MKTLPHVSWLTVEQVTHAVIETKHFDGLPMKQ